MLNQRLSYSIDCLNFSTINRQKINNNYIMNKIFIIFFLNLIFCNVAFGETYFFKECKIGPNLDGNFLIDSEKSTIKKREIAIPKLPSAFSKLMGLIL